MSCLCIQRGSVFTSIQKIKTEFRELPKSINFEKTWCTRCHTLLKIVYNSKIYEKHPIVVKKQ